MHDVHQELIELTREARSAAIAGNERDVEKIATMVLTELAVHLDDERLTMIKLDTVNPDLATDLQHRQRRVVERLLELEHEPATSDGECRCRQLADEIVALLEQEIAAEDLAIDVHQLPSTSGRSLGPARKYHGEH
jgi:hemerythrin